jgi:hypothetical protein
LEVYSFGDKEENVMGENKNILKIVVVGGVAGGASFSARARRMSEAAEIIMLDRGS